MRPSPQLDDALKRHRDFWHRAPVEKALVHVVSEDFKPFHHGDLLLRDGTVAADGVEIKPGMVDPVANILPNRPKGHLQGDLIWGWAPYELFWTEAVLGCRLKRAAPSTWSATFIDDWTEAERFEWPGESPWIDELIEATQIVLREAKGRFPVTHPLTHGPMDMLEAAVKTEILYVGFYTNPRPLRRLLSICADAFIATVERRQAIVPPFHGGYMVRVEMGLWVPGPVVWFSADASRNLSAATYRDFLFEIDRRICRRFQYSIIHTHSAATHILPVLLEETELSAIEVTIDPPGFGPPVLSLLNSFKMIQKAGKSLLIGGQMKMSELDEILTTLSPAGLAIRAEILPEE